MGSGDYLRNMLAAYDERGRKTSDRFRLMVRQSVRGMAGVAVDSVLDAGGGDGLLFDPSASNLAPVTTILDLDHDALSEAERRYSSKGNRCYGDLTRMPFPDDTFSLVVCIGTFYNFPSAELIVKGLKEFARVARENGRVIVEFRNDDNLIVHLAYKYAETYDPSLKGLPLHAYSKTKIEGMLSDAGLVITRVKKIGFPVIPLIFSYILETKPVKAR